MPRAALACMVHLYRDEAGVLNACLAVDVLARPVRRAPRGKLHRIQRHPDGSCTVAAQLLFRALGRCKPLGVGAKQAVLVVHEGTDPLVSLGLVPGQGRELHDAGVLFHGHLSRKVV